MPSQLPHANIEISPALDRAYYNIGWLVSDRSFNHADYYSLSFQHLGPIRILNEDRAAPKSSFPTHPHRDAEIFSYTFSGELTHRDSTLGKSGSSVDKKLFYRMKRGDVQFTSAGSGVTHSEKNEHERDWAHFLQIWVLPWTKGLNLTYHTESFAEEEKRKSFVTIISPVKAGGSATREDEAAVEWTIPIHAVFLFGAGSSKPRTTFSWTVARAVGIGQFNRDRKVYVYLYNG